MTRFFIQLSLVGLLFLSATGCTIEGEQGPEGPQGIQGIQGLQGVKGDQGEPGTANVIYSDWTNFQSSNWSALTNFFTIQRRTYPITETRINADILNKGDVRVYVRFNGTSSRIQVLPIRQAITQTKVQYLSSDLINGRIEIHFNNEDNTDPLTLGTGNQYRYIIIPGGMPNGRMAAVDYNGYEAVKAYYQLPNKKRPPQKGGFFGLISTKKQSNECTKRHNLIKQIIQKKQVTH